MYKQYVFKNKLISPINGYACKRITKQNIKQFGFHSIDELLIRYPSFPLICSKLSKTYKNSNINNTYSRNIRKQNEILYDQNPNCCKRCNVKIEYKLRNNIYCGKSCAAKYNNKKFPKKKSIKLYDLKCNNCGVIDKVSVHTTNFICATCKSTQVKTITYKKINNKISKPIKLKLCQQCGDFRNGCKRPAICGKFQLFRGLHKYFGFDLSVVGTNKIYTEFDKVKNQLEQEYLSGFSIMEMTEKYNHPNVGNFSKILTALGIQFRSVSAGLVNALLRGRAGSNTNPNNNYKSTWHTTWNNKEVFLRSSYELDYATQLDNQQIDYEVEKIRIKYWDSQVQKMRVSIVDFYLPGTHQLVEIKGSYTYDEQNMRDRFTAYRSAGYTPKLILEKKEVILK